MDLARMVGLLLLGAAATYSTLWGEGMWEVGAWQWKALTLFCCAAGLGLIAWKEILGFFKVDIERVRQTTWGIVKPILFIVFLPPLFILGIGLLAVIWSNLVCFFDQECVSYMMGSVSRR